MDHPALSDAAVSRWGEVVDRLNSTRSPGTGELVVRFTDTDREAEFSDYYSTTFGGLLRKVYYMKK